MAHRPHIAEGGEQAGARRVAQVEEVGLARLEPLPRGSVRRHSYSVWWSHRPCGTHRDGLQHGGVGRASRIDVDDGEEVALLLVGVTSPDKEIPACGRDGWRYSPVPNDSSR
jgi:hypothetical protein